MRRIILLALIAAGLNSWSIRADSSESSETPDGGKHMLKAVIHINFDDTERQKHGLKNVTNILKEVKEADIEVVCHGGGIGLLVTDQSEHASEISRLLKEGVRFAACENTLRDRSIPKDNLLPGVTTVPSGAVEVIQKQNQGYGYFRP